MDTWRIWQLVLPRLESHHEVLALTLAGHAGGPALKGEISHAAIADAVEQGMDAAGFVSAHIVGNSLGGYVALQLATRGRAQTVVALAPSGGWPAGDESFEDLLRLQRELHDSTKVGAPHAEAVLATADGRRRATELLTTNFAHIPIELLVHQLVGVASCPAAEQLLGHDGPRWRVAAADITCPVRIVWGTEDKLLPWPHAATRYREDWLPHADWVVLEGIGHCPQLDIPLETAELILGFTSP